MIALIRFVLAVLASPFKSKSRLEAENAVLRHHLIVLRRKLKGRTRLTNNDRWFFVWMYRWFPTILKVVTIIQPETLVRWHRAGFRRYWRWKSRSLGGRPLIEPELRPRTYPATDQGISIFSEARRGTDHARGAGRGIRRLARARAPDRGERLREGAERSESARRGGRAIRSNVGVTMGCAVLGSPCRAGTAHVMLFRPIGIERRNNEVTPERPDLAEEAIVVFCRRCRNW